MLRKHNNDEMEEINKKVEEWELRNDYQTVCNFWDNILMENFDDSSVVKVSEDMEVLPRKIKDWQLWDYLKNAPGREEY